MITTRAPETRFLDAFHTFSFRQAEAARLVSVSPRHLKNWQVRGYLLTESGVSPDESELTGWMLWNLAFLADVAPFVGPSRAAQMFQSLNNWSTEAANQIRGADSDEKLIKAAKAIGSDALIVNRGKGKETDQSLGNVDSDLFWGVQKNYKYRGADTVLIVPIGAMFMRLAAKAGHLLLSREI